MKYIITVLLAAIIAGCTTAPQPIERLSTSRLDHFATRERLHAISGTKLAVLPFASPESDLGWQYAEEFSLFIGKLRRFEMVERMQVQKLFEEQDFDPNRIDDATAVRIGKMLGAKGVIVGSADDYVNARLVDTETGAHIWNARMTLDGGSAAPASVRRTISAAIVGTLAEAGIGVRLVDASGLTPDERRRHGVTDVIGAVVADILPSSKAQGVLEIGDVIRAIDGLPAQDSTDVLLAVYGKKAGDSLGMRIKRHGRSLNVSIGLIPRRF